MHIPTPDQVAARSELLRSRELPSGILSQLRASFPVVLRTAEQTGVKASESIDSWIEVAGSAAVADWVDDTTSGAQLALRSKEIATNDRTPLLGRLIQEAQLSTQAARIAPYLKMNGLALDACLMRARTNVASAAYDAAFATSWEHRTVFARALGLAREYLQYILEADEIAGRERNPQFRVRLGIATVLAARFAAITETELQDACDSLMSSGEKTKQYIASYFLEGSLWLYDGFERREALERAAKVIMRQSGGDAKYLTVWQLNSAAIWSRLAGCATTRSSRLQFLDRALRSIDGIDPEQITAVNDRLAFEMQAAYLAALKTRLSETGGDLDCRGVQFPFALRTSHIKLSPQFYEFGGAIVDRLQASDHAGSYLYRDVIAELLSYMARDSRTETSRAVALLTEAIATRRGNGYQKQLVGRRVGLAQAEDQLLLASLSANRQARMSGLLFLASDTESSAESATRLSVLAREVEIRGAHIGALLPVSEDLALSIRNGDSRSLYERAARAATRSHDLTRIELGGRGGVIALHDSATRTGQTFVYKSLAQVALERDRSSTETITDALVSADLMDSFGVIEHLSTMSLEAAGLSGSTLDSVVSVRLFRNGRTLHSMITSGQPGVLAAVDKTIRFLAFIQANPSRSLEPSGVRRSIWETELGRWLRAISPGSERSELFGRWWDCITGAPVLPRRDAHAMNWLIEDDKRVIAVDLESIGWRPFGYELAQLLEDAQIFADDEWEGRGLRVQAYADALVEYGVELDLSEPERLLQYYAAGALARSVRTLSSPVADGEDRVRGGALLQSVSRRFRGAPVGHLAESLVHAWSKRTGLASDDDFVPMADAERRRISRAMSYHLRHNESAPVTKDGWIHSDELAGLLRENGHKVSARQLLLIAGALGEPRFDLDGDDIRSSYGHSTKKASVAYESRRPPEYLYHATPLSNLRSILEAQDGIRRGQRQWVHMTDSVDVALSAARRQRKPVVVLAVEARDVADLVFASGHTWLAPRVSNQDLRVLTVTEIGELIIGENLAPQS